MYREGLQRAPLPQGQRLSSLCKAATDLRLCGVETEASRAPGATHTPLRNVVCLQKKLGPVCVSSFPTQAQANAHQIRKTEKGPEEFSPSCLAAFFLKPACGLWSFSQWPVPSRGCQHIFLNNVHGKYKQVLFCQLKEKKLRHENFMCRLPHMQ